MLSEVDRSKKKSIKERVPPSEKRKHPLFADKD